jgi:hypothetical protein
MTALYLEFGLAGLVLLLTAVAATGRPAPRRVAVRSRSGAARLPGRPAREAPRR